MEGTRTSATAMLVGTRDVGGRPAAATVTVAREEIEEALASDESPELTLEIHLGEDTPREMHVAWPPGDIETVLAGTDEFEIDQEREKFLITFNPSGYLRRVR